MGGEFALTVHTTEGDAIFYYLRTLPGTTDVEVLIDNSQDQFSTGPGWRKVTCSIAELSAETLHRCMTR